MRDIRVSNEVWQAIADRGKFGETEDDVLRRVFKLPARGGDPVSRHTNGISPSGHRTRRRVHRATKRMSTYVEGDTLVVRFVTGEGDQWHLPDQSDKSGIRKVRDAAVEFAEAHGATLGQQNAVKKALTDSGFHLMK